MPKTTSKNAPPAAKKILLQIRLRDAIPREADAMQVLEEYRAAGWKDRDAVTEAFIALGQTYKKGWTPAAPITDVTLNQQTQGAIMKLLSLVNNLHSLAGVPLSQRDEAHHQRVMDMGAEIDAAATLARSIMGTADEYE